MKRNKQKNSGTSSFPIDSDGTVWVVWGQPELYRLKLSDLKKIANSDWTEGEDGKQIRHKIVDNHGKTHMMTKSEAYSHIIDIPKKIIRLTESDLVRIVKRVISESKDKDHNKIEKLICSAMDRFVGEDDYTCGYKESSDKPYDRFMVKIKNVIDEDTEELAEDVVKYVNRKLEKTTLRVGNTSKEMFWLTYTK
jgi:hypothetical protein